MKNKQEITKKIRAEAIKRAKLRIKDLIKIEVEGNKVTFKLPSFSGCYNINKGGGDMSLNQADKEWIKEAIVIGVAEGIKPVVTEMHHMEVRLTDKINAVDAKVDALDTRLTSLETKVDALDTRLTSLETKVDAVDAKLDKHIIEGH